MTDFQNIPDAPTYDYDYDEAVSSPPAKKKRRAGDIIRRIVLVLAILVFLGSAGYLGVNLWERWDARQESKQLQEIARPGVKPGEVVKDFTPLTREALDALKKKNPDFIAWITMPGTNIDYPVVQGKDNDEYLHKTFEGNRRTAGTLFMDMQNDPNFKDFNSVIYGHHMKDKSMFQNLTLLRERENFDKIRKVYVQLYAGDILEYEISSVYICHADYDYRTPNYATDEEKEAFIKRITEKSSFSGSKPLTINDKILTLSTCDYDYGDARLAVHGRFLVDTPLENWNK